MQMVLIIDVSDVFAVHGHSDPADGSVDRVGLSLVVDEPLEQVRDR